MIYCHTCGSENDSTQNYCYHDGTRLNKGKNIKLAKQTGAYCPSCGVSAQNENNYCFSCGHAFFEKKKAEIDTEMIKQRVLPDVGKVSLFSWNIGAMKPIIVIALAAFLLMFSLSYITFEVKKDSSLSLLQETLSLPEELNVNEMLNEFGVSEEEVMGVTSYIMSEHFVGQSVEIKGGEEGIVNGKSNIELNLGLFINILIPALICLIAGGVIGKKYLGKASILQNALTFSFVYGLLLSIVSFFAGYSASSRILGEELSLSLSHSFFGSLFKGFGIALIFSLIGSLIVQKFNKESVQPISPYRQSFVQALFSFFTVTIASIGFMMFMVSKVMKENQILSFISYFTDSLQQKSFEVITTIGAQLGIYFMNLAHFGKMKLIGSIQSDGETEGGEKSFSLLSGLKESNGDTDLIHLQNTVSDFNIFIIIAVVLFAILFAWSGFRLSKNNPSNWQPILVYSAVYSLLMGFITFMVNLSVNAKVKAEFVNEQSVMEYSFSLGFNSIFMFISSFIFVTAVALAGAYIGKMIRR
ncbi:zinc ribbon domain-containing protein [Bacillus sp. JJ722]|uniref:zinc ribbon domain-containing protein n=1 Tax=Bacillus sp. JJ722 TaxID=3122973 RepID=UPI002FFFDB03